MWIKQKSETLCFVKVEACSDESILICPKAQAVAAFTAESFVVTNAFRQTRAALLTIRDIANDWENEEIYQIAIAA